MKRYIAAVACGMVLCLLMGEITGITDFLSALTFCAGPCASGVMA